MFRKVFIFVARWRIWSIFCFEYTKLNSFQFWFYRETWIEKLGYLQTKVSMVPLLISYVALYNVYKAGKFTTNSTQSGGAKHFGRFGNSNSNWKFSGNSSNPRIKK